MLKDLTLQVHSHLLSSIGKISMTSRIIINVPTGVVETKGLLFLWLAHFKFVNRYGAGQSASQRVMRGMQISYLSLSTHFK